MLNKLGIEDLAGFMDEIETKTDKFAPHSNFAKEEALFELKSSEMRSNNLMLDEKLADLNVSFDRLQTFSNSNMSAVKSQQSTMSAVSRASSRPQRPE